MNLISLKSIRMRMVAWGLCALTLASGLSAQDVQQARQRVQELERQLQQARQQLREAETRATAAETELGELKAQVEDAADLGPSKIRIGDFAIGGAIRANYVIGDYATTEGPGRGSTGGNFGLDTFRVNVDYADDQGFIGKLEYRWYNGYNFLHTGYVGYEIDEEQTVVLGVNRVPFGVGAYGPSASWFFDQHYYVGLSDDMDFGVRYTTTQFNNWTIDAAYYLGGEGTWLGASKDSARYSYDSVVNEAGDGYSEEHQFNLRGIYSMDLDPVSLDLGGSLQYGLLNGEGALGDDDGDHFAISGHAKAGVDNFTIMGQLTYYNHDTDFGAREQATGSFNPDLILMGAYDFPYPVAAEGWIPAISVAYTYTADEIDWLDSVTPYIEYSRIVKSGETLAGDDFNDSELFMIGAAWARGGWYIYTDWAWSNGNYFVGLDDFTTFGINPNDEWQQRFNINFGYYF